MKSSQAIYPESFIQQANDQERKQIQYIEKIANCIRELKFPDQVLNEDEIENLILSYLCRILPEIKKNPNSRYRRIIQFQTLNFKDATTILKSEDSKEYFMGEIAYHPDIIDETVLDSIAPFSERVAEHIKNKLKAKNHMRYNLFPMQ